MPTAAEIRDRLKGLPSKPALRFRTSAKGMKVLEDYATKHNISVNVAAKRLLTKQLEKLADEQ